MKILSLISGLAMAVALTACGGGGGSGGSSSNAEGSGALSLTIKDGPVENASAVVVSFTSVEIHGAENKLFEFDTPQMINLLEYQGDARVTLLDGEELAAGAYQWIRLGIDEAGTYIEIDGQQYPLEVPSGSQSGLKLQNGFTIGSNSESNFTIDFDLRKSVHQEGSGDYKLRPTLRIVDDKLSGTIMGSVDDSLVNDSECNNGDNNDTGNIVYLFEGTDTPAQDLQGNDSDPYIMTRVAYSELNEQYEFMFHYIPAGQYIAYFTCDAVLDINNEDDSDTVSFSSGSNLMVTAGTETQVTIP